MGERDALDAAAVVAEVEARWGQPCASCGVALLGHDVVVSLLLGARAAPRCCGCLALHHRRDPREFLRRAAASVRRLDCFRAGWVHADRRLAAEIDWPEERLPAALRMDDDRTDDETRGAAEEGALDPADAAPLQSAATWDAGHQGCGELVLELRKRMSALRPGDCLQLTARDPGAPEDLPAWCRLTGHRLRGADHPTYLIERRPD